MVRVLIWVYQCSSLLLILFSVMWWLLTWVFTGVWMILHAVITASSVVGKILFTGMITIAQYSYYGLSYLPYGLYSIAQLSYSIVTSLTINGWVIMKNSIWPAVMQCILFIISMVTYMINMMCNIMVTLFGYTMSVGMVSVEFIQHTAGPFIASIFSYLLYGVVVVFDHSYSAIMTVLYYLTEILLRIIEALPGVVQPLASDVVYYGSDIVAMVISAVFNVLRWTVTSIMMVTELLVTTPAFWAILIATVTLSYLYYYYIRHWHMGRLTAPAPAVRREDRRERYNNLQSSAKQSQPGIVTGRDETDSSATRRKKEKFEEELLCVVCQFEKKTILLQPCNHLCLCHNCVEPVLSLTHNRICPMCRKHVHNWIKVYL